MYVYKKNELSKNITHYIQYNYGIMVALVVLGVVLGEMTDKKYIKSVVTLTLATFITWSGHYLLHNHNEFNPISWIHQQTHHSQFAQSFLGKFIEYVVIEFLFFGAGITMIIVLLLEKFTKLKTLNPYVLLFWGISVPFIHEFHYHMLHMSSVHKVHHKNQKANYSPDFWDVALGKKQDNSIIENENLIIPPLIIVAFFIFSIVNTKYDFIKKFLGES
jgi:hypothetical protein